MHAQATVGGTGIFSLIYQGTAATGSFDYDANGNMTRDASQQTDLSYNHRNLLDSIITDAGEKIVMVCDALGVMQERQTFASDGVYNSRVYLNPIEINNGFVDFVHHENGYVKMKGQVPDHLTRIIIWMN